MTTRVGATPTADGTRFDVWAPNATSVDVVVAGQTCPLQRDHTTQRWTRDVPGVGHGDRYRFRLDGADLADPASRWQPDGVHGPSAVVDPSRFVWSDADWRGVALADTVLYELHVGTFTPQGTFDAAIGQLARLRELGVTTIELMPVNAFPGVRNWGYDGVFPSAVQHSYGGPEGLARLVDAAHAHGLGVVLDVVYNHLGPEGAVLNRFGPYFVDTYPTPWGDGLNVAEAGSDEVRRFFIHSAVQWITDFHVDGLRLDAIDTIIDPTAQPFLEQLLGAVHTAGRAAGRQVLTFVESAANNPAHVRPVSAGGYGSDAAWNDDFHHALRVALTGERPGYYADYDGVADVATALEHRWVFSGRYSPYRGRHHGRSADSVDHERLVVFTSNHDHVGNTPHGDRPPFDERQRLAAAAAVILSPFTPMLFMGEEYGETRPFPFFVDHGDEDLREAVRVGRRREFERSDWPDDVADPTDPATFQRAVLDTSAADKEPGRAVVAAYTRLLTLRRTMPVLHDPTASQHVDRTGDLITVTRRLGPRGAMLVLHFGADDTAVSVPAGATVVFDASDAAGRERVLADETLSISGPTAVLVAFEHPDGSA